MPSLLAKMEKRTLMRGTCCLICMLKVPASMLRRSTVFNVVTSTSLRLTPRLYWEVLPVWLASLFALRFHQQCMPLVSDHSCCVYIIFDPYIIFMLLCCSLCSWYKKDAFSFPKDTQLQKEIPWNAMKLVSPSGCGMVFLAMSSSEWDRVDLSWLGRRSFESLF